MFLLYQLTKLFELAWKADSEAAAIEISKLADFARDNRRPFVEDLLRRCIMNLSHGRPVGYFGDADQPIELSQQAQGAQLPSELPSEPPSGPKSPRRARRKSG